MPTFDPELNTLHDFVTWYKERLDKDCDDAVDFGYNHTWDDDPTLCPNEYTYYVFTHFLDVLGPELRAKGILRLGDEPFWSARAWMTVRGLTDAEYHFLFARAYPKYAETFGKRVENGSLGPGTRGIPREAAPGGAAQ
jgi:hypothetical protein